MMVFMLEYISFDNIRMHMRYFSQNEEYFHSILFCRSLINSQRSDQPDDGTRTCYHRWAVSEQSLQAHPPFFLPQAKLSLLCSMIFFFAPLHLGACSQASFSLVTRVLGTSLLFFISTNQKL